ncbi:MAG: hypothetical protein JXA99_08440 [Candidatus Lokiarchaeota archaeon]|nr:hypothetical protein [Candidatus Lokiarchaeota archaeon]
MAKCRSCGVEISEGSLKNRNRCPDCLRFQNFLIPIEILLIIIIGLLLLILLRNLTGYY